MRERDGESKRGRTMEGKEVRRDWPIRVRGRKYSTQSLWDPI